MLTNRRDAFKGQSRSSNMIQFNMLCMVSYYCPIVTLSPRRAVFQIFDFKNVVTLKWGSKVTQGHRNRHGSICHLYFLLTLHSNYETTSYRFRDNRRFQSKIANFSHPRVFNALAEGVFVGIEYRSKVSKTRMRLPDDQKSLDRFGRLDTIPACDGQTAKTAPCRASRG